MRRARILFLHFTGDVYTHLADASPQAGSDQNSPGPRSGTMQLQHLLAGALARAAPIRGLHVFLLFGRRKDRGQPRRLDPELPTPAGDVIEMLVFLLLYLVVGLLRPCPRDLEVFGYLAKSVPVQVIPLVSASTTHRRPPLGPLPLAGFKGHSPWRRPAILRCAAPRAPGVSVFGSRPICSNFPRRFARASVSARDSLSHSSLSSYSRDAAQGGLVDEDAALFRLKGPDRGFSRSVPSSMPIRCSLGLLAEMNDRC